MFLIKIEADTGRGYHPDGLKDDDVEVIEKSEMRFTVICRKPYAFRIVSDDRVIVGESVRSISNDGVGNVAHDAADLDEFHRRLPDDVLILVSVNVSTGRVFVGNSIAGCRSYYHYCRDGVVCISNSLKLMARAGVPLAINDDCLPEYYAFRLVAPPRTLYAGIGKLVAGQAVEFDVRTGQEVNQRLWWPRMDETAGGMPEDRRLAEIDALFRKSMCDVFEEYRKPFLLLSGGADSSLLGAVGKAVYPSLTSMSTSFSFLNRQDKEDEYAISMADQLGISHTIWKTTSERYLSGLVDSVFAAEEPLSHLQSVLLYIIFADYAAGQGYDLTLNGIYADGLFGDDIHYTYYRNQDRIAFLKKTGLHGLVKLIHRITGRRIYRLDFLTDDFDDEIKSYDHVLLKNGQYVDAEYVKRYFNVTDEQIFAARIKHFNRYRDYSMLDKIMVTTLMSKGGSTMEIWNNLAESQGMASYYPFAAPQLINYAETIPWSEKLVEQKRMVRALLDQYGVPRSLIERPKKSFGFPVQFWALPGTLFQPLVDMAATLYDAKLLRRLQDGDYCHAMLLWNMLNVYIWRQLFENNIGPEELAGEILDRYRSLNKKGDES